MAEKGIKTAEDLAVSDPRELSQLLDVGIDQTTKYVDEANRYLESHGIIDNSISNGLDYFNQRTLKIQYLDTGASNFNEALGDGYESGVLTELYGKDASGKTQCCFVACVLAQLPRKSRCYKCEKVFDEYTPRCPDCKIKTVNIGGLSEKGEPCKVLYLDTEGSFRPDRILQIVYERELVPIKEQSKSEIKRGDKKQPLHKESEEKAWEF